MLKDSTKCATFWEYASSRKSIKLSFAKVQSCNALAAITLPPPLTIPHRTPPLRLFIRVFALFDCNQTITFVSMFYIVNGLIKRVMS